MHDCELPGRPGRWLSGLRGSLLGASLVLASLPTGAAISVTVTDAKPTLLSEAATCKSPITGKDFTTCKSTTTVSTTAIGGVAAPDVEFKKSFDAWNAGLPAGGKWTLVSAGLLPGGTLKISVFDAFTDNTLAGVEIRVLWDYDGITKDQYFWAQGLLDNYTLAPLAIVAPFYELDNAGSGTSALYPFQYADKHFYDKPAAPWPNSSFIARALLARQDSTFRTLTVYEGIAYSFALSGVAVVPEPASVALALAGLAWLLARRLCGADLRAGQLPAWPVAAAGLLALAAGPAWGQAGTSADLHLGVRWCAPASAARVEVAWINTGATALALWPLTDTDTGPQHDALRIESGAWSAALIAPRKHAAARWCGLAPGQRHALVIDLAAWQQRLLPPGQPQSAWRLVYQPAPGRNDLPAPWPACVAGTPATPMSAAAWEGRLVAPIGPFSPFRPNGKRTEKRLDKRPASAC